MADMGLATREDDHGDRIEPEREMGRSGPSPWGCCWSRTRSRALGYVRQRKQRKMMLMDLASPALDRSGNRVVEVSCSYAGGELRLASAMAIGSEATGRLGALTCAAAAGKGERRKGKP
ncbi:hypothetical protein VPH35_030091 [Triticum aestivum]